MLATAYADTLEHRPDLADICFTAATRRSSLPHRLVAVGANAAELSSHLRTWSEQGAAAFVVDGLAAGRTETAGVVLIPRPRIAMARYGP